MKTEIEAAQMHLDEARKWLEWARLPDNAFKADKLLNEAEYHAEMAAIKIEALKN